jgi:hypothetical protein
VFNADPRSRLSTLAFEHKRKRWRMGNACMIRGMRPGGIIAWLGSLAALTACLSAEPPPLAREPSRWLVPNPRAFATSGSRSRHGVRRWLAGPREASRLACPRGW